MILLDYRINTYTLEDIEWDASIQQTGQGYDLWSRTIIAFHKKFKGNFITKQFAHLGVDPINELKGDPITAAICPISNLHRCIPKDNWLFPEINNLVRRTISIDHDADQFLKSNGGGPL